MITKNIFNRYLVLALTLVFTSAAWAEKVISLNFGSDQQNATMADQADGVMDGSLAGDSIPANSWNDYSANSATDSAVTTEWDGTAKQTLTGVTVSYQGRGGNYRPSNKSTTSRFMNGYIDDNYNSAVSITVSGIPYATYDVIVYYQGDNGSHKFTSLGLNGKYYTYSEEALKVQECVGENGSYWGTSNVASPSIGGNALRIDAVSGETLTIAPWHSTEGNINSYTRRSTIAAVQIIESRIGSTLQWTNNGTDIAGSNAAYAEYRFLIPATDDMKRGSVVEVSEIKIAQRANGVNAPSYLKFVVGENDVWSNIKTTESNWQINNRETPETRTVDVFTFSNETPLQVEVGETYAFFVADANKSIPTNLGTLGGATAVQMGIEGALLWWHHEVSETRGHIPVYEVTAKLVSLATEEPPIGPDVTFTVANDTDWAGFTLPTQAKEKAATGNVSFAGDISYRQTLDGRKATVALVTNAQAGNLVYGLHAFNGGAGLGAIDRDIYLMVTGGTPGVISGGEDANWSGAKTIPTGNLLVNIKGDTTVDYVYGAGLGGGTQNPLAKIDGNIGIVVEENAQVKGSLVGGWQSRHNAIPEVTGNVSILIKNIQTHEGDATIQNDKHCVQGFIAGGGVFNTNNGRSLVRGNTSVAIDLPNDAEGSFMKHIVAGGLGVGGGDGNNVNGNASVVISAPDTVIFPKNIMGGGHSTGTNKAKVGGNSSVTINGGTYTGTIFAAGDNGDNTLVSGTATLTINDGNLSAATLTGGAATEGSVLNVNGGKFALNAVTGFATINIGNDAEICFSDGSVAGNAYSLTGCTTLTCGENTSGLVEFPAADILVGSVTMNAAVTLDLDNKTVMYTIPSDSTLTRRADSELNGNYNWKGNPGDKLWLNGNNEAVDWPEGGATYVNIDADKVSKIIVDTKVKADMITLTNTASEEGSEFRFETLEDLGEVAQEKDDPKCVIEGKLSAAGFAGKLYLQSRITQEVTLGDETRVMFVAGIDEAKSDEENAADETTAYPYTFKNLRHPIGKIGLGVFTVPSSMYGYQFNVEAGYIAYDSAEDFEFSTAITGAGGIIKRGTGTMTTDGNQAFTGGVIIEGGMISVNNNRSLGPQDSLIVVKTGGVLEMNSKHNNGNYLELAGGTLKNTGSGADVGQVMFKRMSVSADSFIELTDKFGIINSRWGATTLDLGTNTLTKRGSGSFIICNVTVNGAGKLVVEEGNVLLHGANSSAVDMTLELKDGSGLSVEENSNSRISVGELIKHGNSVTLANIAERASWTKLELAEGCILEMTGGATLSYSLSKNQNGTIKITNPGTDAYKLADVDFAAIPETLDIVNAADNTSIKTSFYVENGGLFFGNRYTGDTYELNETQITKLDEMTAGRPYAPDPTLSFSNPDVVISNLPEGYLAKNIDGTLYVIKKTNSISIKFGPRGATEGHIGELDENVGGFPVMGMFWNHSKDYNDNNNSTTEIFKVKDGNGNVLPNTRVFYSCPNTYFVNSGNNHQTTGNGKLTYSYFDDQNRAEFNDTNKVITGEVDGNAETYNLTATPAGRLHWEVGVENVPYQMFDLYIYQASDLTGDSISLLPIAVKANNGEWKYFAGDGNGSTIGGDASSRWNGAPYCDSETMVEGLNYIRYRMSAAALGLASGETINTIYLSHPAVSNGRLGLAGIQLVAVDNDGLYTRQADPADMGGDDDERNAWTREDSWKKSDGTTINWPTSGERNVTINADQVKAIRLNTAITATKVNLVNSATTYTQGQKIFKFLTLEDLDDVATPKDNPEYILDAPVDATGFCGDLYLQSRISGMVSLGANTHITFVAMEEGKETTAYPYSFAGTRNAIRKIGLGTFRVPGSMYNMGFNIAEGYLRFNDNGTYTGTITGNNPVIVTASDFKMSSASQFNGASEVVVKEGASFDQNGLTGGSTTVLTLDGGAFVNNKAVSGLETSATNANPYANHPYPIKTLNVTKDSTIGGTQHFGLVGTQWSAVTMNMSNDVTLSKTGTNVFAVVNLTINGNGTIDVQGGTFATRRSAVSATDATIIVHDGAKLDVGSDLSVGTLAGDGTLVGSGRLSVKAIDTTKGSDIITIPEGFNIDLPDILTAVVNDDSAPILNGITEGIKLPTYIQIKTNGQPMKYHPVVRDGMLYAEKINVEGILIPTIEHTTVTVKADGQLVEPDSDNMISVMEGTKLEVTYTAEEGYYIKNGTISFVVLSSKDNTIDISKVIVSDQPLTIIPIVLIETKGTKLWIKNGIVDEEGLAIEGDTLTVHAELRAGYSSLALTVNDTPVTLNGSGDAEITVLAPATFIKTTCTKNN